MPQAKKKKSTKTTKKTVSRKSGSKATKRTCCKTAKTNPSEKWHVYIMTALSMILGILLCAEAAIFAML